MMRNFTRMTLVLAVLMFLIGVGAPILSAQVSLGIRIGPPPPPRVLAAPVAPGPGYVWVGGYWYPVGGHYRWHAGYWSLPPYPGARWVGPHHDGERFFAGYWVTETVAGLNTTTDGTGITTGTAVGSATTTTMTATRKASGGFARPAESVPLCGVPSAALDEVGVGP